MIVFSVNFYLFYSFLILFIGLLGVQTAKKNFILLLISLEIMFLAINLNLAVFGLFFDDISPHILFIFSLVIAGSEAAVGLALFIAYYKKTQFSNIECLWGLKG